MASQYGVLWIDKDGRVDRFVEKPFIENHWINVGFMVFENEVFEHFSGTSLELDIVPRLIERSQVYSYRHSGFFKSVDSYKDVVEFEEFFASDADNVPWISRGSGS
jgi:glucose-1-phosphate cytidylyltransferase